MVVKLETQRLFVRDNCEKDLADHFALISDPLTMRYLPELYVKTIEEANCNLQKSIAAALSPRRKEYFFAIILRQSNKLIGSIGYTVEAENEQGKLVNLGYFIRREYWGMGYTLEAARRLVEFAFLQDNVLKIETGCLKENTASEKIMIRLGMRKEAELLKHQLHEGRFKDRVVYGLRKNEWKDSLAM